MKKTLLIALILITNFVSAQTFTKYVDNTQSNGQGFCYNVTIRLTLLRMAAQPTLKSAGNSTEYSVELVRLDIDKSKGWYERGKTYNCDQLEGICNVKNYDIVNIGLAYNCAGRETGSGPGTFYNVGDKQTIELNTKDGCSSPTASGVDFLSIGNIENSSRISLIVQKLNNGKSSPATQTGATNTGMPANTSGNDANGSNNSNPLSIKADPKKYELKYSDIGIPEDNNYNNSRYSSPTHSSDKTVQAVGGFVDAISAWGNQAQAERERKEEAEQQRAEEKEQREAEAYAIKAKKMRLVSARKAWLAKIPDGKTPLSYEAKEVSVVYFFVYSYQQASIENDTPVIYISNVFSIEKYGDGTWPFTDNVMEDVSKKIKTPDLRVVGYYTDKQQAEEQQQFFVKATSKYDFDVKSISYIGKKLSENKVNTDYWGNPIKKEAPKTTTPSQQEKATTESKNKVDFWGNPLK